MQTILLLYEKKYQMCWVSAANGNILISTTKHIIHIGRNTKWMINSLQVQFVSEGIPELEVEANLKKLVDCCWSHQL